MPCPRYKIYSDNFNQTNYYKKYKLLSLARKHTGNAFLSSHKYELLPLARFYLNYCLLHIKLNFKLNLIIDIRTKKLLNTLEVKTNTIINIRLKKPIKPKVGKSLSSPIKSKLNRVKISKIKRRKCVNLDNTFIETCSDRTNLRGKTRPETQSSRSP